MIYKDIFKKTVKNLKEEAIYRDFTNISRIAGQFPKAINVSNGQEIINWCSNDYLCLGQNSGTIDNAINIIKKSGIGSGGTRNISGTSKEIVELEKTLSDLHQKEASLAFNSGYIANESTIATLAKIIPNLVIFSDAQNHSSIISGVKNSGSEKYIFQHNNIDHLEELLQKFDLNQPKLIIFESVYSMSGDFGNIEKIVNLAKKYHALTFLDEVHAVGIYGNGAGRAMELGLSDKIDIIQGTLGKAFGVIGGYISANREIIASIKSLASSFIFTTSMPPLIASCALYNISYIQKNKQLVTEFKERVAKTKFILKKHNIPIQDSDSHIIPLIIGDQKKTKAIYQELLEKYHIYLQNISYPTVKYGGDMLRIAPSRLHTDAMIDHLAKSLQKILNLS